MVIKTLPIFVGGVRLARQENGEENKTHLLAAILIYTHLLSLLSKAKSSI